jgi:hypothetical protein
MTTEGTTHQPQNASLALPHWQRALRWGTLAGLGAAAALTAAVLLRYPVIPRVYGVYIATTGAALVVLAAGAWWSTGHARTGEARRALALGSAAGLVAGVLWLACFGWRRSVSTTCSRQWFRCRTATW